MIKKISILLALFSFFLTLHLFLSGKAGFIYHQLFLRSKSIHTKFSKTSSNADTKTQTPLQSLLRKKANSNAFSLKGTIFSPDQQYAAAILERDGIQYLLHVGDNFSNFKIKSILREKITLHEMSEEDNSEDTDLFLPTATRSRRKEGQ